MTTIEAIVANGKKLLQLDNHRRTLTAEIADASIELQDAIMRQQHARAQELTEHQRNIQDDLRGVLSEIERLSA